MSINVFTVHTGDLAVIFSSLSKELLEVAHGVRSYETYILKLIIFSAQNYTKNTLNAQVVKLCVFGSYNI